MQFNPEEYETVKSRKEKFYKDYPEGRIIVELVNQNHLEYALFKATLYTDKTDVPKSTGYALEVRDKELSTNKFGKQYESVNYSSWTENCEESAVGRALDNAGYSGNKKPSLDEMQKAQRMNSTMQSYNSNKQGSVSQPIAPKSTDNYFCEYHKVNMRLNKNGKPYHMDSSREEGDKFCNGTGYPSEHKAWTDKIKDNESTKLAESVAEDIHF